MTIRHAPPRFTDGMALSASKLNALGDAVEQLYGRITAPNFPVSSLITHSGIDMTTVNARWYLRHRHRYLHYKLQLLSGTSSGSFYLTDDGGTDRTITATSAGSATTWEGYVDTNSWSMTDGTWYVIYGNTPVNSSGNFRVTRLGESDSTSLSYTPGSNSYAVPDRWAHGDGAPTGAEMNKYRSALLSMWDLVGNAAWNPAIFHDQEHGPYSAQREGSGLTFVHTQRWLHFRGTGEIVDPAGIGESVSIQDEDTVSVYDLDSVSWLSYGDLYRVEGANFAAEDWEP